MLLSVCLWGRSCRLAQTEAGWTDLGPGQNFTQDDVELNRLWYTHTTSAGFKGHDSFRFVLSDLDNESPQQSFFISVRTVQRGEDPPHRHGRHSQPGTASATQRGCISYARASI